MERAEQTFLSRHGHFLGVDVEVQYDNIGVRLYHELLHHLVDSLQWYHRNQLSVSLIDIIYRRHWLSVEEVILALGVQLLVGALVLVAVLLVEGAEELVLVAGIFCRGEPKLRSAACVDDSRFQCFGDHGLVFGIDADVEGIDRFRQKIHAVIR